MKRKVVRAVLWTVIAAAGFTAAAQLSFHSRSSWLRVNSAIFRGEAALGYLVGILYAWRMRHEYPARSGMRRAWNWMTAGVSCFFAYQSLDTALKLCPALHSVPTANAWLIGVTSSLALLLLGLFQMWWTLRDAGISPDLSKKSCLVIFAVMALTAARMAHGLEPHHASASVLFRSVRGTSPLLVGAGTVVAFLLYRSTAGFAPGQFSHALRGLIFFFAAHLLLFQLDWYPALWDIPWIDAATDAVYYVLPWILACALANCWQIGLTAAAIAQHYRVPTYWERLAGDSPSLAK